MSHKNNPYYCGCGKSYKNKRGLHEHKNLKHGKVLSKGSYKFKKVGRPKIQPSSWHKLKTVKSKCRHLRIA